jgi:hypothetical protein
MPAARTSRFATAAAWPVAILLATLSFGGLTAPSIYARELPAWSAQAVGQDWFDLLIAAPWIAACGVLASSGSFRWSVLLAGAYAYTVYELVIYAFAVHFNALFLVYCATLGLAGFALIALVSELRAHGSTAIEDALAADRRGRHLAGGFLVGVGTLFGALWLAQDVPAVLANRPPRELEETGLFTNPVHVVDLAFVLPAHILAGILLWRDDRRGALLAPIVIAFGILMAASIGAMLVVIALIGGPSQPTVAIAMFVIAAASAALLARTLYPRLPAAHAV